MGERTVRKLFFEWLDWVMRRITFIIILVALFATARWYEATYMPVVPVFNIDRTHWDESVLTVWGKMDKVRPCNYGGVQVFYIGVDGEVRKARTSRPDPIVSRPPIEQRFGPIFVDLPQVDDVPNPGAAYKEQTPLDFWATHECHTGWTSYSQIASFIPPPRS